MLQMETRFAVLIFTDIVGSAELKVKFGVPAYSEALRIHNRHFERLARECHLAILQNMGDGYFGQADGIAEAVRFALLFQDRMREGPWGEVCLTTRVGIHAGEVSSIASEGGTGIVAPAADLAARVMSLAVGGQILLTRLPFDEARHFIREHPVVKEKEMPPLQWLAHGPYRIKGRDETLEIFEVGAEGLAPLTPPPDGEKAKRFIRAGEEETLGWRPAGGLEIPGRSGWHLVDRLGEGGFGEVWSGEHAKLRERRAFKFCFDDERLRALKREVTLVRLLRNALGDRDDIVRIHELKLDEPPFYLESDLAPHGNLLQWAANQGGLVNISLETRIGLVEHTATALAAAHSLGVLHKDIKPTNILIFDGPDGGPRPRLVDFGIGMLADPVVLAQFGVTQGGFTRATIAHSTGTPTYSPPELLAGKPYTIQGDIFGLGVLLYQLVTAKPNEPLAPGWERDVKDPLLREDIAACVDGDPARRLASAAELAERLETLDQRRTEIEERERLTREASARAEAEALTATARASLSRSRKLVAAFAAISIGAIASGLLAWHHQALATSAASAAEREKARATGILSSVLRSACVQAIELNSPRSAVILIGDPRNGQLLGGVSVERREGQGYKWREVEDIADSKFFEPGSLIRPLIYAIALEKGVVTPETTIFCHNGLYENGAVRIADSHPYGTLTARGVVVKGSNIASYLIAKKTGRDPFLEDLGSIAPGAIFPTNSKSEADFSKQTCGYGMHFSPRTALQAYATITPQSEISRFSKKTRSEVTTALMLACGLGGTSIGGKARYTSAAGAAATSKMWDPESMTFHQGRHMTTFAGYAPARSPRYLIFVMVEEPQRSDKPIFGSTIAGPIFSTLVDLLCVSHTGDAVERLSDADSLSFDRVEFPGSGEANCARTVQGDVSRLLVASNSGLELIDRKVARELWSSDSPVINCFCNSTGTLVGAINSKGTALIQQIPPAEDRLICSPNERISMSGLVLGPNGDRWISISESGRTLLRQFPSGDVVATLFNDSPAGVDICFSPDGQSIVGTNRTDRNIATLWNGQTGSKTGELSGHVGIVWKVAFSRDGALVATSSSDGTTRIWDTETRITKATCKGHKSIVHKANFSPDGSHLITVSKDGTAKIWHTDSGSEISSLRLLGKELRHAGFSPDGSMLAIYSDDRKLRLWDLATGEKLFTADCDGAYIENDMFNQDGTYMILPFGGRYAVYDLSQPKDATER